MENDHWELLETVTGDLQAELLKGLLEAQGISVYLSQEGAGRSIFPVLVGKLSQIDVLVPSKSLPKAKEILDSYRSGEFETESPPDPDST